jgi:hypothetical protein
MSYALAVRSTAVFSRADRLSIHDTNNEMEVKKS